MWVALRKFENLTTRQNDSTRFRIPLVFERLIPRLPSSRRTALLKFAFKTIEEKIAPENVELIQFASATVAKKLSISPLKMGGHWKTATVRNHLTFQHTVRVWVWGNIFAGVPWSVTMIMFVTWLLLYVRVDHKLHKLDDLHSSSCFWTFWHLAIFLILHSLLIQVLWGIHLPRGKSLRHLAFEISHFSKGFLTKPYDISDLLWGFPEIFKEWFTFRHLLPNQINILKN